jgi:hypothetical protein
MNWSLSPQARLSALDRWHPRQYQCRDHNWSHLRPNIARAANHAGRNAGSSRRNEAEMWRERQARPVINPLRPRVPVVAARKARATTTDTPPKLASGVSRAQPMPWKNPRIKRPADTRESRMSAAAPSNAAPGPQGVGKSETGGRGVARDHEDGPVFGVKNFGALWRLGRVVNYCKAARKRVEFVVYNVKTSLLRQEFV